MKLEVRGLNAWYGPAHILHDVGFDIASGEALALIGRNGAGKSTTMRAVLGLVDRREGDLHLDGTPLVRLRTHEIVRLGLGYVPEDRRVFADLTVAENLLVGRRPPRPGLPVWTPERLFELFPNLAALRDRAAGRMSGGEQQMLAIARTLMGNPALVFLDEPSEGLAPRIVEEMTRAILAMKNEGVGIVVSEQNLAVAHRLADRAVVLESGHVRFRGTMAELEADAAIREAYLAV